MAVVGDKEIVSPDASSREMKFRVLSKNGSQELNRLKKTGSHLALGIFYSKVGLIAEADEEFQRLVALNPKAEIARKLFRSVRSLRNED